VFIKLSGHSRSQWSRSLDFGSAREDFAYTETACCFFRMVLINLCILANIMTNFKWPDLQHICFLADVPIWRKCKSNEKVPSLRLNLGIVESSCKAVSTHSTDGHSDIHSFSFRKKHSLFFFYQESLRSSNDFLFLYLRTKYGTQLTRTLFLFLSCRKHGLWSQMEHELKFTE